MACMSNTAIAQDEEEINETVPTLEEMWKSNFGSRGCKQL